MKNLKRCQNLHSTNQHYSCFRTTKKSTVFATAHTLYFCISRDHFAYFTIWSNTNSSSNSSNSCNKPKVHMLSRSVQFQVLCIYVRLLDTDFKVFITNFSGKCNIKEIDFDWPDSYDTHTWSIVINRSFVQSPNASPTTLDKYCGEKEAAARKYQLLLCVLSHSVVARIKSEDNEPRDENRSDTKVMSLCVWQKMSCTKRNSREWEYTRTAKLRME